MNGMACKHKMGSKSALTLAGTAIGFLWGASVFAQRRLNQLEPRVPEVDDNTALLFQFAYSPYCVKARYCLDYKGIPYRTVELTPLLHSAFSKRFSGQRKVPYLRYRGQVMADSSAIARYLDLLQPTPPLFPAEPELREEVLLWEDWLDEAFLPALSRLAYLHYHEHPEVVLQNAELKTGMPLLEPLKPLLVPPMIRRAMFKMGIAPGDGPQLEARFWEVLERVKQRLQDRDYLVGENVTLADLSLAASLSVLDRLPWLAEHRDLQWLLDWRTVLLNEWAS